MEQNIESLQYENISQFEKRSWALKPYAAHRWGNGMPCPLRLVVNPYQGCDFNCKYCYTWFRFGQATQKPGNFKKSLKHDIQRAKNFGLNNLHVMLASSTDPFQPIETKYNETLFALKELIANDFSILIMTKNPRMLLGEKYIEIVKNEKVFINVTIPSLYENDPQSIFYSPIFPTLADKIEAIKELIEIGKDVKIKIEPVIPSTNNIQGQTEEELWELVRILKNAGIKMIISKTMRLNKEVPPKIYDKLFDFYDENGSIGGINYILSKSIRKQLLSPVFEACKHYGVPFSPCVETDLFPNDETFLCSSKSETESSIAPTVKESYSEEEKQSYWERKELEHINSC